MPPNALLDLLVPCSMFILMTGMGLTLTGEDFRRIAEAPATVLLGTLLQLVVMPGIAALLALAFGMPPLLAAGLVIIGACPGGMFSNVFVHIAGANTALSVTLTATATLVTLFTLPLWIQGILGWAGGGSTTIEIPVLETAMNLAGLTVLPVLVGMVVRRLSPGMLRFERWATMVGAIGIVSAFVLDASGQEEVPVAAFWSTVPPVAVFTVSALAVGLGVGRLCGQSAADTVTITVELVVKNTLLGIVIAQQSLPFEALLPVMAFATLQTPAGVALLAGWRALERRKAEAAA